MAHNGSLIPVPGRDIMVQAWYQGGRLGIRFHRLGEAGRDRVLRSRPARRQAADHRRILVDELVQRQHLRHGDRPRRRRVQAEAERVSLAERDRGGDARPVHGVQRAATVEDRLAGQLGRGACVSRSAGAHPRASSRRAAAEVKSASGPGGRASDRTGAERRRHPGSTGRAGRSTRERRRLGERARRDSPAIARRDHEGPRRSAALTGGGPQVAVLTFVPRTTDRSGRRALSRRHALSSLGASRLPRRLSAAQRAV